MIGLDGDDRAVLRCSDPERGATTGAGDRVSLGADVGIFAISIAAGLIGALAGVGGGILIVPALTLLFVIDMRIGMFLELATTSGAVCGALLAAMVAPSLLYVLLGIVLLFSAIQQAFRLGEELPASTVASPLATRLRLAGSYPDSRLGRDVPYVAIRIPLGFVMMAGAGVVSGLLGIGSGVLKVLAMDGAMRLPMKVSSATSNFMIGVTAAASAGIYLGRGDVDVTIAGPVALGVLAGAMIGARILPRLSNRHVRLVFLPVLIVIGLQTLARGLGLAL
jgi:hypothetical protein